MQSLHCAGRAPARTLALLFYLALAGQSSGESDRRLAVLDLDENRLHSLRLPQDLQYGSPDWSHDGQQVISAAA